MSEEKVLVEEAVAAVAEEKEEKKEDSRAEKLEIFVAIMLGITAVFTAWATWVGSLHGGNQATSYAQSNNMSALGNSDWNEASQTLMQDMLFWNNYYEYQINYEFAVEEGDDAAAEKYQYMMDVLLQNNCSDGLAEAIEWAQAQEDETGYVTSPFEMEGFQESYFENANAELEEAEALLEDGQQSNKNGDNFNLVTVIYSVVLFLLGIVGIFKKIPCRLGVFIISCVAFLGATIFMWTLPLPW